MVGFYTAPSDWLKALFTLLPLSSGYFLNHSWIILNFLGSLLGAQQLIKHIYVGEEKQFKVKCLAQGHKYCNRHG